MRKISESIEAEVPVAFAHREWGEFIFRSQYGGKEANLSDTRWWVDESGADKGVVKFATEGPELSRITVELQTAAGPEADESDLRVRLRRDLDHYRDFVLRRCDETHCRAA
jgi:hypothetical protein